jgi:cytochrome c oxidase cbb3-type subunit III
MRTRLQIAIVALIAAIGACKGDEGRDVPLAGPPAGVVQASNTADSLPAGVMPGIHERVVFGSTTNPYTNDPAAAREGRQLFLMYNCVGCHGGRAGGGMGPSLRDSAWTYGNSDADLFATITEGRPAGMPTWGGKIPEDQIWKLIAYVRTLRTAQEPDPPPPSLQPNR